MAVVGVVRPAAQVEHSLYERVGEREICAEKCGVGFT